MKFLKILKIEKMDQPTTPEKNDINLECPNAPRKTSILHIERPVSPNDTFEMTVRTLFPSVKK